MKKEDIHFTDLNRWLFGSTPPEFLWEVLLRTIIIYLFLLFVIRLMGKCMTGQITITELSVMITLGAIVSPVMQLPEKGILFGIVALICAYIFQRGITLWGVRSKRMEKLTQGTASLVIKDGIIEVDELKRLRISRPKLFSILREKKIQNLGEVERAYWEACGICSVYKYATSKAGLPVTPVKDRSVLDMQIELNSGLKACSNCGHTQNIYQSSGICKICGSEQLTEAYIVSKTLA